MEVMSERPMQEAMTNDLLVVAAQLGERLGEGESDAAIGTGDEYDGILEFHVHKKLIKTIA